MSDFPGMTYIDTAAVGSPETMAVWLTSLGWRPDGDSNILAGSAVRAIVVDVAPSVVGEDMWVALVRATEALVLPAGITPAPDWVSAALNGRFAAIVARTRTKVTLYERMTDSELATLDTLLKQGVTLRQRMSWMDATIIEVDRPDVQALAYAAFGAERAAVILA